MPAAPTPASPMSFTPPGGAITPQGGQRQKSFTIATNLNIDGRLLAQMISDHIISMMTDPDGAAAPSWLSTPHGPDSQFSAA
jgi:hypothetical protein